MSEQTYLVPANSKRSALIFGFFKKADLIIFSIGVVLTLILLGFIPVDDIVEVIITLFPIMFAGFLVFPLPNYHNVRTFIGEFILFYKKRRKYVWRGWCYKYEQSDE